jgi:hypothetical protein
MSEDFYRRLNEEQEKERIARIFKDRPENLHDYQGCENDPAHLLQRIKDLELLQNLHLDALRRVSAALGNPFAGDMTKTCTDLGLEVSRQLTEARKDAAEQSRAASQLADALVRKDELRLENERLRKALERLRDCDWVISLPDRMDAVRKIAREALETETK